MDVYELAPPYSRQIMEHACNLRQPSVFPHVLMPEVQHYFRLAEFRQHYAAYDWTVRSTDTGSLQCPSNVITKPFAQFADLISMSASNTTAAAAEPMWVRFYSEHNAAFLADAGLDQVLTMHDAFFRPASSSWSRQYDVWTGEPGAFTPLRYESAHRTFLYVTEGRVTVKITAPRFSKYLYTLPDAWNQEMRSPVVPWIDIESQVAYPEAQKVPFMNVTLEATQVLFLPARWWYSVEFSCTEPTTVVKLQYTAWLDALVNLPRTVQRWVQRATTRIKMSASTMDGGDRAAALGSEGGARQLRGSAWAGDDDVGMTKREWHRLKFGHGKKDAATRLVEKEEAAAADAAAREEAGEETRPEFRRPRPRLKMTETAVTAVTLDSREESVDAVPTDTAVVSAPS